MKDEKILENEILSDEELENVAGGTLSETSEICRLITAKTNKRLYYSEIADFLKRNYGIEAKLNGIPDHNEGTTNIYKLGERTITHAQVLETINFVENKFKN